MKYSAIILAFAVGVFALPQDASTITSAPASTTTYETTPQASCLAACPSGDVTCAAQCVGGARPNASQVIETNECAAKCDQGSGSKEDTDKFAACQQDCYAKYFPSSQTLTAGAAAASSDAAATGSDSPSGTDAKGTGAQATGSSSATDSAPAASATGAASLNTVHFAGAGLAGLALAVFGL